MVRILLLLAFVLGAAVPAGGQPSAVTVSSFYGELTVTADSVRYTTPTFEGAVSRDVIAVLTRPDMIAGGGVLPDRSDPWPAETIESHLVFADYEGGGLPAFPALRGGAVADSLADVIAQIEAAADSLIAANVAVGAERDSLAARVGVLEADRDGTLALLRALLIRLLNP